MAFKQNYTGISPLGGIVDEDKYHVTIDSITETRSRNGDPMVKVKMKVLVGEVTKDRFQGSVLWANRTFNSANEQMSGFNKHFLSVIGQPHDGEFVVEPKNWVGRQLWVTVKHEMYDGKQQANIKKYEKLKELAEPEIEEPKLT